MYNKINSMEMQIMKLIWDNGDMRATDIDVILQEQGWSHSTVYTTIRRCVDKGFLKKRPGYWCHALLTQELYQRIGTEELIDERFEGSATKFFASFLDTEGYLTKEDYLELKKLLDEKIEEK